MTDDLRIPLSRSSFARKHDEIRSLLGFQAFFASWLTRHRARTRIGSSRPMFASFSGRYEPAGREDVLGRPAFNIAGSFANDDVVVESVMLKLSKTYETSHPIELIAYFSGRARGLSREWIRPLQHYFSIDHTRTSQNLRASFRGCSP